MPCNSDYLELREAEKNSREAARHIMYIVEQFNNTPYMNEIFDKFSITIDIVITAVDNPYGDENHLDQFVQVLCYYCFNMSTEQQNRIIYNGRDSKARNLANWWDEHQKADAEREHREMVESKEYQINSSLNVARGRLENDADPNEVIDWLEEEIGQIFKGEILFED